MAYICALSYWDSMIAVSLYYFPSLKQNLALIVVGRNVMDVEVLRCVGWSSVGTQMGSHEKRTKILDRQ